MIFVNDRDMSNMRMIDFFWESWALGTGRETLWLFGFCMGLDQLGHDLVHRESVKSYYLFRRAFQLGFGKQVIPGSPESFQDFMIKSKFPGFDTLSQKVFVFAGDADVAFALLGCLEELHGSESATELQLR